MAKRPTISVKDLEETAAEACANGSALEPETPALVLAAKLVDQSDRVFAAEYSHALMVRDYTRRIRSGRRNGGATTRDRRT